MATVEGGEQDKQRREQEDWEAVVSGQRLPVAGKPVDEEAEAVRQVLLWRDARQRPAAISPDQAAAFYQQVDGIRQQRAKEAKAAAKKPDGKLFLLGAALLGVGLAAGWWLSQPAAPVSALGVAPVGSTGSVPVAAVPGATPAGALPPVSGGPGVEPGDLPQMVSIPAGTFTMGCTPGWDDQLGGCRENESPAHAVVVQAFALARHEVTVAQFQRFVEATAYVTTAEHQQQGCAIRDANQMAPAWVVSAAHDWRNPGFGQAADYPVVCVSWQDAQAYVQWLSKTAGRQYRLPREAEWEYAARGGRITAFYWGSQADPHFANTSGVVGADRWQQAAPVGQFTANPYGLHDMAGNVWEWVADCWQADYRQAASPEAGVCPSNPYRARRGGGWDNVPASTRSAARSPAATLDRSHVLGFRVAHDLP